MGVSLAKRSRAGKHICDKNGAPLGALDGPTFAEPGRVVWLADVDMFGRVRLWWRCCGAVLVEFMVFPDEPERAETYTARLRLDDLSMPPHGRSYSVPCAGSAWSLSLPCGHLKGEGCDCDTIALEAEAV